MTSTPSPRRPAARGFTLIEVLVSILVFSLGILGAVGMQARVLQGAAQTGDRTRASLLANEIVSQMWARQNVNLPSRNITAWNTLVGTPSMGGLPNGTGTVSVATAGGVATATVKITWKPTSAAATAAPSLYTTTVVVP